MKIQYSLLKPALEPTMQNTIMMLRDGQLDAKQVILNSDSLGIPPGCIDFALHRLFFLKAMSTHDTLYKDSVVINLGNLASVHGWTPEQFSMPIYWHRDYTWPTIVGGKPLYTVSSYPEYTEVRGVTEAWWLCGRACGEARYFDSWYLPEQIPIHLAIRFDTKKQVSFALMVNQDWKRYYKSPTILEGHRWWPLGYKRFFQESQGFCMSLWLAALLEVWSVCGERTADFILNGELPIPVANGISL